MKMVQRVRGTKAQLGNALGILSLERENLDLHLLRAQITAVETSNRSLVVITVPVRLEAPNLSWVVMAVPTIHLVAEVSLLF